MKTYRSLALVFLMACFWLLPSFAAAQAEDEASPSWVPNLEAAAWAKQLLVVAGVGDTTAWISLHEKADDGSWHQLMSTPGLIGQKGLGKTKEGDHKTPVGTFRVDAAFGFAPDPGCAIPYTQIDEYSYWSGDRRHNLYNRLLDIRKYPDLDTASSEHLIQHPVRYRHCLNVSYFRVNQKGVIQHKGFGIFLQCLPVAKPYTEGGVAIPEDKLVFFMQHLMPECVIVIDSLEHLGGKL